MTTPRTGLCIFTTPPAGFENLRSGPGRAETDVETSSYDTEGRRTKGVGLRFSAGNVSYSIEG